MCICRLKVYRFFDMRKHITELGQTRAYLRTMFIFKAVINKKSQLNVTGSREYLSASLSSYFVSSKAVCEHYEGVMLQKKLSDSH